MGERTIERRLLSEVLSMLGEWQIAEMMEKMGRDTELGEALCRIVEEDCLWEQDAPLSMEELRKMLKEELDAAQGVQREFFKELIQFVDRAEKTDSQLYNEIGMNRTLWYRLRDNKNAKTSKGNVLKMAICLHLDYWEMYYLVNLSGYSLLPRDDNTDRVVSLCIRRKIYDKREIDELLVEAGEKPLFSVN